MSEVSDIIVVDLSALTSPKISRPTRRSATKKKKQIKRARKGKDETTADNDETEEEVQAPAPGKDCLSSRKRERVVDTDEEEKSGTFPEHGGEDTPARSTPRTRTPSWGQFKVGGGVFASIGAIRSQDIRQRAATEDDNSPENSHRSDTATISLEEEASESARYHKLELSKITSKPPPDRWYDGIPSQNGQWTICIKPPKPTWYHPDWDATRRKKADLETKDWVEKGERCIAHDRKEGFLVNRKTKLTLITRKTVIWWQCHYYRGRKSWSINISLNGYDAC